MLQTSEEPSPAHLQPFSLLKTNDKVLELILVHLKTCREILDIGAGEGHLAARLLAEIQEANLPVRLRACDLYPGDFKVTGLNCDRVDLNQSLPYDDGQFDLVYSVEVFEHLENQFQFLREVSRILKPDGRFLFTTPNILNINSRIRYFLYGFYELFEILPLRFDDQQHLGGHIKPISLYYACHMASRNGFEVASVHIDRMKRSGAAGLVFYPLIKLLEYPFHARLRRKFPEHYGLNRWYLRMMNSPRILLSRTIILDLVRQEPSGPKPVDGAG